jgi:hypothetical protein
MVAPRHEQVNDARSGVGGWLLLLCLLLLIWHPVSLAMSAARALTSLPMRGLSLAVVLLARLLVAGLGVGAGLALLGTRRGAVAFARWALILAAAMDLFVYLTSFLPSNRPPGTTPLFVAASLLYYGTWIAYLSRSRRVRNTFPAG